MIPAVFRGLCPNLDELRTHTRELCLEDDIVRVDREFDSYVRFFASCLGSPPWEIQKMWAKRALARRSFAAIAPTGVGKTAFGLVTSYYFAYRRWGKSYLIFPTSLLVDQAYETLSKYTKSAGHPLSILYYRSGMSNARKNEFKEKLVNGDFDVLITTSQYLARNYNFLLDNIETFSFIFVDDVDSFLKNSRNIDRVLMLLGFSEGDIKKALSGEEVARRADSVLIVSTATGKPGARTSLFRRLLGFDVGVLRQELLRNITDVYTRDLDKAKEFMKEMGSGLLVFVPRLELAEDVMKLLDSIGLTSAVMSGYDENTIERFKEGELDALIGAAKPYGVLIRGVDLPQRIRYVFFYGVPRFEMTIKDVEEMSDNAVIAFFSTIAKGLDTEARRLAIKLRRGKSTKEDLMRARDMLREILMDKDLLPKLAKTGDLTVIPEENKIVIPDIRTYIQGSGRSSRLYPGGLTRGASLVWDLDPVLSCFLKRASAYDIEFSRLSEIDLHRLKEEIDEDRRRYGLIRGRPEGTAGLLKTALFVVESPNKARTIARFFGRPGRRAIGNVVAYEVTTGNYVITIMASGGHVVDLSTKGGYHGVLIEENGEREYIPIYSSIKRCMDCGYQFTEGDRCPKCGSVKLRDSRSNIESMRWLGFEASRVIIGTDPDTEGEKIAWDIYQLIADAAKEVYRAEFHEVTKRAILEALSNLGTIDEPRVKAQIVRRVEDRWIGFELSEEVQKRFNNRTLSAGRAQTPTLGWIIQRYAEYKKRKKITLIRGNGIYLRVDGELGSPGKLKAKITSIRVGEDVVRPPPPFTTDEMIREASRVLKIGAKRVMDLAQTLFEAGLITYHRTDSTRVSDAGIRVASEVLGDEFVPRRWGEGGAHECIRPTKPLSATELLEYIREGLIIPPESFSRDHIRLYDLIYRRFIASQAKESRIVRQRYKIVIDGNELEDSRVINIEGGWATVYPFLHPIRPPVREGTVEVEIRHVSVPSAPLYTQGEIVALMKERGIGRPSTYATIIDKLLARKYVMERKGKLIPTRLGIAVHKFLTSRYPDLISEERTRILEQKMLAVEEGKADYQEVIDELYEEIQEKVVKRRVTGPR